MERKRNLLVAASLLIFGLFVGGAMFSRTPAIVSATSANVSKGELRQKESSGQRWEYCTISKAAYVSTNRADVYWITYFRNSGLQVVDAEDNAASGATPGKVIAKLGDEGWEMVGTGTIEVRGR